MSTLSINSNSQAINQTFVGQKVDEARQKGMEIWFIYGLTGFPPHLGHVNMAEKFAKAFDAKIIWVMNRNSTIKPMENKTPGEVTALINQIVQHKLQMHQNILEETGHLQGENAWVISDVETKRQENASKMSDTMDILSSLAKDKKAELFFLGSLESFSSLPTAWFNPLNIVSKCTLVYGDRLGKELDPKATVKQLKAIDLFARQTLKLPNPSFIEGVEHFAIDEKCIAIDQLDLNPIKNLSETETINGKKYIKIEDENVRVDYIKPIAKKVIDAISNGYVPIASDIDVSSTEIRNACIEKRSDLKDFLTTKVGSLNAEYIINNKLFIE